MSDRLPITIVVAMNEERYIGKDNQLMWRLPTDLKRFKEITFGGTVIMGRKTYESIGKPLPGRENIIISRNDDLSIPGCLVRDSIASALESTRSIGRSIFVIGGGEIYREALPYTDQIEMTVVNDGDIKGDTQFPVLPWNEWSMTASSSDMQSKDDEFPFTYVTHKRKST